MSRIPSLLVSIKKLSRFALVGGVSVACVAAYGFYNHAAIIKGELLSQSSGRSFAILDCDRGSCATGTYFDLSDLKADIGVPQISSLKDTNLTAISSALTRSNIPYKFSGRIALYEVGNCNHILRDAPETFHSLYFAAIEEGVPPTDGASCDEINEAGPCLMRVRLLEVQPNRSRYQIVSTLNSLSYLSSGLFWTWL